MTHVSGVLLAAILTGAGAVCSPGDAVAAPAAAPGITYDAAWIRLPPPAAQVAAGYIQLHNAGADDRLVGATCKDVAQVQIHAMRMDGDVMRMHALPDGLPLAGRASAALQPGGYHLMLMTPKRPLQEGQVVRVLLQFERAGTLPVDFVVRNADAMSGGAR
ncbi:copper chaperone PCu(A)C [Stenotrophomonas sp.]|uniref:copper chaperone PCu(A)C n=1 Tax=Stenotrophomonas sp. TaxID=69392 RepID=UPI0028AC0A9A|nr:copper chaperone PCu(A)C [Stenotrophomonas sp.]